MIDLHIHTTCSDGTYSPVELLKKAKTNNLDLISITDHDSIDAYKELDKIKISDFYDGKIITGIEIKTAFEGIPIEILGYGIDINQFKNSICVNKDIKIKNQLKYLENFKKVGKKLGLIFNNNITVEKIGEYAATTFYDAIIINSENKEIFPELKTCKRENFYRTTSGNKKSPFYINEEGDSININLVIEEIHKYGGKAFLAHLYQYKIDDHIKFLGQIIKNTKIDGVECYYSIFTDSQTKEILEITKKSNLYISGGSDYHGENKPSIKLGIGLGNLNVLSNDIDKWLMDKYLYKD